MDAIPWLGVAGLVWAYLTTEHFRPWVSWHSEVPVFAAVLVVALTGAARLWARGRGVAVPRVVIVFAAFAAIGAIQAASGRLLFTADAIVFGFYMALAAACVLVGFNAGAAATESRQFHLARAARIVAHAVLAAALISTAIAFAQAMDVWESRWIARVTYLYRPGGNLAQPNHLATLIGMGLASVAMLHLSRHVPARGAIALALFLLAGLAATQSRSGALSVAVLLAWWQWQRPRIAPGASRWAAPALGAAFVAFFALWPEFFQLAWPGAGEEAGRLESVGASLRWTVWPQLLQASLTHPWFGWGVLEVAAAHNSVLHAASVSEPYTYGHNIVLDLALWMGWPVAILASVLGAGWLASRVRAVQDPLTWFCLAALLPLGVHAFLEFPHAYAYFLAPVLVLVGVLEAAQERKPLLTIRAPAATLAVAGWGVLLAWSAVEYLEIEEDFRVAGFEALRVGDPPPEHRAPDTVLLAQLGALPAVYRHVPRENMTQEEIEQLRKVALRFPWGPTQYRYSLSLALNGRPDEAVRQLLVLRALRGDGLYQVLKAEIGDLSAQHPALRTLPLP